jgi:hypothetical protein
MWCLLCLAAAACSAGDDVYDGARAECAEGGTLEACPEADRTPEGACWRLVDCGVIPVRTGNGYDWGTCVRQIEGLQDDDERVVIDCIAVSTCDALKVSGSPDQPNAGQLVCFEQGGGQ